MAQIVLGLGFAGQLFCYMYLVSLIVKMQKKFVYRSLQFVRAASTTFSAASAAAVSPFLRKRDDDEKKNNNNSNTNSSSNKNVEIVRNSKNSSRPKIKYLNYIYCKMDYVEDKDGNHTYDSTRRFILAYLV